MKSTIPTSPEHSYSNTDSAESEDQQDLLVQQMQQEAETLLQELEEMGPTTVAGFQPRRFLP